MSSEPTDLDVAGADFLAAVLEAVAEPVWVVNHAGLIRFANSAAVAALGYADEEELIGRDTHQTIHHHRPDGRLYPAAECPFLHVRTTGEAVTTDLDWFFRRDGTKFPVSYVATPLEMPDGRNAVVAFTDIEARLRVEDALREREGRLTDQLAALRRVAILVASGTGPEPVFQAMADEVQALMGADESAILRFEADGTVTVKGGRGGRNAVGTRVELNQDYVIAAVRETGSLARFDTDDPSASGMPEVVRALGIRSGLASPIVVDGKLWGAITVASLERPLPAGTERRLAAYTDVVATAISSAEAQEELRRLADEQAVLRRVATLVAQEAIQANVFTAVAEEIGHLLGTEEVRMLRYEDGDTALVVAGWGEQPDMFPIGFRQPLAGENATSRVFRTGRPARIEDYGTATGPIAEAVRATPIRCVVAAPIVVEGRLWGAMVIATTRDDRLPPDTESRLGQFTELMATAIANAEARAEVERLADEQASLRRVATLVATEASLAEVFAKVAAEVASALGDVDCTLVRDDGDGTGTAIAVWGSVAQAALPVGARVPIDGDGVAASVLREGRPYRISDYSAVGGSVSERTLELGIRAAVGCPIEVGGRTWGAMVVTRHDGEPFPPDTETRIAQFSDLVSTAIVNAEAHAEVERLADEQAALRRVATLVAQGRPPAEIFSAVSDEVGRLFGVHGAVIRFESEGPAIAFVGVGKTVERLPVGTRWELDDSMASAEVYRTGRPARVDAVDWSSLSGPVAETAGPMGVVSTIASPIFVEGRRWGAVSATSTDKPLPLGAEERLGKFTELVATAIANTEAREALRQLAEEQVALRRVATLVAEGAPAGAVFDAVAAELEGLLGADGVTLSRYEPDDEVTVVAHRGTDPRRVPPGTRVSHQGENVTSLVRRSQRSVRMEHGDQTRHAIADLARGASVRASVGAPIVVDGRLWGVAIANWRGEASPPADTEERMAQFAELLDTAIANADSRDQLTASRVRLLTEADEARRRVVRDLHDGAQQRLVGTILSLKVAQQALRENDESTESHIAAALEGAEQSNTELRELAHGILPPALTHGGLQAGIRSVVTRLDLPVDIDVPAERFSAEIEASAYFVVAEALTNVVKHAHAERAEVRASAQDGMLRVEVQDDGIGGADPAGHGLVGMSDRVTALGGWLNIKALRGGGTLVAATLPLSAS
jgi:PAS domain S-box-containing protein